MVDGHPARPKAELCAAKPENVPIPNFRGSHANMLFADGTHHFVMTCRLTQFPIRRSSITINRYFPFNLYRLSSHRVWRCRANILKNMQKNVKEMVEVDCLRASSDVLVADTELLDKKIVSIQNDGPSKLQVIADFDCTLTKYWVNGHRGNSSHSLLRQENPEYDAKRQKLYEYYHPLEFSPAIPLEQKAKLMEVWWEKSHALLIEGGLTYSSIEESVANATIALREGVAELFELLEERDIPLLIFSAGLADIIEEVLRQKLHRSFKNIRIVSNRMAFDADGKLVNFKGKTIHVLNKNEHALDMAVPVHDHLGDTNEPVDDNIAVKKRTNVLLLGDHIGDLGMSDGLNYETRISVGFLNDNVDKSLESYRRAFDVIYMKDAAMWGVVNLVSQLCPSAAG